MSLGEYFFISFQVLTTTKLTTQTVTDYKPALPNQNSQLTSYLNRIKLLKTILNLRQ